MNKWKGIQENSSSILAEGMRRLQNSVVNDEIRADIEGYGNYLISYPKNKLWYIGESKNVSKRVRQHANEKNSTFYKSYLKNKKKNHLFPQNLQINDFNVQSIENKFGRKELEEFGIMNIPCVLNNFQKGKRNRFSGKPSSKSWQYMQNNYSSLLKAGAEYVEKLSFVKWFDMDINPFPGLYLIEHKKKGLIYIGESSNVLDRYKTHSGTTYFSAFRRNLGENILGFQLKTIKGKKRYFNENEENELNTFLKELQVKAVPVSLGRYELEEFLIKKYKPVLNRKGNIKPA